MEFMLRRQEVREQPLSEKQRELVDDVYALYEAFREGSREYCDEIRMARQVFALKDPELDRFIDDPVRVTPQLNTLNSTIDNMVADFIDNMPECVCMPERPELGEVADNVTDVMRWVLESNDYKSLWRDAVSDATVLGTGVLQVFFDGNFELGGVPGNVRIQTWKPECWLPDPLYEDFQDGRAVFKVNAHPLSYFAQRYPKHYAFIQPDADEHMEQSDLSRDDFHGYDDPLVAMIECWYRRYDAKKERYVLNMCQLAGGALIYDSREEDEQGVYAHGRYPFVTLRFRKRAGTAYGTGMIHEFADTQRMINRNVRYMDENARASSKPKLLVGKESGIDIDAATDYSKTVVTMNHVRSDAMQWFQASPLNSQVHSLVTWLQDTQKQDSGQNQFSRGEGGLGVTAASAINMLQEAGGKITRMHTASFNGSFRELAEHILALAAEFMDEERVLLITGVGDGEPGRNVRVSGLMLRGGVRDAMARPAFSVRVQVQRNSPQQVQSFNQLVMQIAEICAQAGNPLPPEAIVRLLRVSGKDELLPVLRENDAIRAQLEQLSQTVEQLGAQNQQLAQQSQAAMQESEAQRQILAELTGELPNGPIPADPAIG